MKFKINDIIRYDIKWLEKIGADKNNFFKNRKYKITEIESRFFKCELFDCHFSDHAPVGRIESFSSLSRDNFVLDAPAKSRDHQHPLTNIFK